MKFKDTNNQVHEIEKGFEYLLPEGCVEITDKEAQEIIVSNIVPPTYDQLRAAEYPPITDYLDAVVKDDKKAIKKYIDTCKKIKKKYPKE